MGRYQHSIDRLLRDGTPLTTYVLDSHHNTSDAEVFIVHDVFKIGPSQLIQGEYSVYQALREGLGEHVYEAVFPRVVLLRSESSDQSVMEIEWLGDLLLNFIAELRARLGTTPPTDADIISRLTTVDTVAEQTLRHFDAMFSASHRGDATLSHAFFNELILALESNLRKAGASSETFRMVQSIAKCPAPFVASVQCSLCHRDASTDNIFLCRQGDSDEYLVKLGDPRRGVPFLDADECRKVQGSHPPGWGCSAADFAALLVSLYREEQELQRVNPAIRLGAYQTAQQAANRWVALGRFPRPLLELSIAAYLSLYVGCKCEYCTAPERNWLYELMVSLCNRQLAACAAFA